MTPMQHRAVLVCILCVLAVLLTFGITTTLLKKGGEEPAPSVSESVADPTPGEDLSGHYQIDGDRRRRHGLSERHPFSGRFQHRPPL